MQRPWGTICVERKHFSPLLDQTLVSKMLGQKYVVQQSGWVVPGGLCDVATHCESLSIHCKSSMIIFFYQCLFTPASLLSDCMGSYKSSINLS